MQAKKPRLAKSGLSRPASRVAFTCDFLRFVYGGGRYSSFQSRNLAWLVELLTGNLAWKQLGVDVNVVLPPTATAAFEQAVGNPNALSEYQQNADHAWAQRYDTSGLDIFPAELARLCEFDLVVGFEIPPTLKRHLHANGRPYVNFYVHPLRFLRDLCFGATTNVPAIADWLGSQQIPQFEIESQVRRFRALFVRRQPAACAVPPGLPILVGQTEFDSVLIRNGRFSRWEDHAEAIAQKLSGFEEVVFLEHPYRATSASVFDYLRSAHGKTVIATNANGYGTLFSNSAIPKVVTLASSLGVEAHAMGLQTDFLIDDPRRIFVVEGVDVPSPGAFGHSICDPQRWRHLLADMPAALEGAPQSISAFAFGEDYLRTSLEAWAFRPVQQGAESLSSRKTLIPSATLSNVRQAEILAGLTNASEPLSPSQAADRAKALGLQLELREPPLRVGEEREVQTQSDHAAQYLAMGFHAPASGGYWTSGLLSRLSIPVAPDALRQQAVVAVRMELHAAGSLLARSALVQISHEAQLLACVFFRPSGATQQVVDFMVRPQSCSCEITLELSQSQEAALTGEAHDRQPPGVELHRLTISCQPPNALDHALHGAGPVLAMGFEVALSEPAGQTVQA